MRGKKKKDKRNYFITVVMYILNVVNKVDCFHICVKFILPTLISYSVWNFLIHEGYWPPRCTLSPDSSIS